ncbi:hypothetical protein ACFV19_26220 [Streptomyces griseoluteus]|uniref:hypothetical protein n=1 Tax=Streptomyces griseoluteus TaxID=29306 RepID=UPI0036B40B41
MAQHNGTVLVIGDVTDDIAVEDLTAFAFDVAARINRPVRVALDMQHDVTEYEGVVLAQDWWKSVTSAVLGMEALQAEDLCVLDTAALYGDYTPQDGCVWCGEGDATPVHDGCFAGVVREAARDKVLATL